MLRPTPKELNIKAQGADRFTPKGFDIKAQGKRSAALGDVGT